MGKKTFASSVLGQKCKVWTVLGYSFTLLPYYKVEVIWTVIYSNLCNSIFIASKPFDYGIHLKQLWLLVHIEFLWQLAYLVNYVTDLL